MLCIKSYSTVAAVIFVSVLALVTALLAFLALRPPELPAGDAVSRAQLAPTPSATPAAEPQIDSILFIGDVRLDDWAMNAAEQLEVEARVETRVTLFDERQVTDVIEGDAPDAVVIVSAFTDLVSLNSYRGGLRAAFAEIHEVWPDTQIFVMPPHFTEPVSSGQRGKAEAAEEVTLEEEMTWLDAEQSAESFLEAWESATA